MAFVSLLAAGAMLLAGCGPRERPATAAAAEDRVARAAEGIREPVAAAAPETQSPGAGGTNATPTPPPVSTAEMPPAALPVPEKKLEPVAPPPNEIRGPQLAFRDALAAIQSHYPELQKQQARLEGAVAGRSIASAGYLPRLNLSETFTRTDDPVGVFMAKLKQESFTGQDFELNNLNHPQPWNDFGAAVRVEIPLFDAFQTIAATRAARHQAEGARAMERFMLQESVFLATDAYLKTILLQKLRQGADESLAAGERDVEEAVALVQKGMVLGADYYAARVAVSKLRQLARSRESEEQAARSILNILMGKPVDNPFSLTGLIPTEARDPRPVGTWIEEALAQRSDLAAAEAAIRAAEAGVQGEKGKLLPSFSAFAQGEQNTRNFGNNGDNYTVGVKGSIDLYDPAYAARVRAAKARLKESRSAEGQLRDQVSRMVAEAATAHEALLKNLDPAEQAARDAVTTVALTERLYREGRKSVADLASMRLMQLEVSSAWEQMRCQAETGLVRLLFVSGQLDEAAAHQIQQRIDAAK